jgi:arylsulfatase
VAEVEAGADGKSTIRLEFDYDAMPKLGAGGTATLFLNDNQVGSGRIGRTQFAVFSVDETANIGIDRETPVSSDYTEETSRFTGTIDKVRITLK